MPIKNHIESQYRSFNDSLSPEYEELYQGFEDKKLQTLLSTIHAIIIDSFNSMNGRLPSGEHGAHYWAEPSRDLLKAIEGLEILQRGLKNSKYAFTIEDYYNSTLLKCKEFLRKSGGSSIPPNMEKIDLYYTLPIFLPSDSILLTNPICNSKSNLTLIGEGSYAHVYKYKDEFYQKDFILKRAKKNLNEKELKRFFREFEIMKQLTSPYIIEVYNFNLDKNEYIMEYMDYSLSDYIKKNNSLLTENQRKNIGKQVLKAFSYLHQKQIFHRDISSANILIKQYEHTLVVKISDFGLVKIPTSDLTSTDSDFKGSLNDPRLKHDGFENYGIHHEIYALTQLLFYILTGKTNINNIQDPKLRKFTSIGMNADKNQRFSSIDEIYKAFNELI